MLRKQPEVKHHDTADLREPTADEIRAQLERILGSRCFQQAGRSSKFLRFVAEHGLAGQGERLKGYTIAVEVFGRPADFDAQNDPLVRVEAGRLRRRLAQYYAGEGQRDPLRAELPRGSYSVVWSHAPLEPGPKVVIVPPPSTQAAPAARAEASAKWRRRQRAALLGALLVATASVVVVRELEPSRDAADRGAVPQAMATDGKPAIVVQPFDDLGPQPNLRGLAEALTEETLLAFDEPELFVIATDTRAPASQPDLGVPGTEGAQYVLSGSVRDVGDGVRITARVLAAGTGAQLWATAFDEPSGIRRSAPDQERIARRLATVAEPYGPIFDAEVERVRQLADTALRPRDCVVKYYDYRRRLDLAAHGAALACFERVTKAGAAPASAWGGLALVLADRYAYGYGVPPAAEAAAALDRAREAARTAMDIDGDDVLANLALAQVQFYGGEDFRRVATRVLARRPEHAQALALLGTLYVFAGEPERGLPMVDHAIELTAKPPAWLYATRALGALRMQRTEEAMAAALRIDAPDWPLGQLVVAATAALAGRGDLAERARHRLLALDPRAAEALPALLERWHVDAAVRAELARGFAAGATRVR
ncbi:MAG TPA: hypothetical protein VHH11_09880 [Gammaproteobacteria bacterium]|nr:hypothetical protein [Gammaproteobacteria bacterium]